MTMIRACFLFLAVLLPASWTVARADDKPADSSGDMKKSKKKSKKSDSGDMGDMKKGDMKKGDMDKK
ncbi:MAG TPA: hypothetical protein VKZ18_24420 [Polyangia bacterium]|nr:hypothetical protein [Polyangia bacterium]